MSNVYLKQDFAFQSYQVVITNDSNTHQYVLTDGNWTLHPLDPIDTLPCVPSLVMPEHMLQAFAQAAMNKLPIDPSVASHLKDAMAVRDRLFTYLEFATGKVT